MYRKILIVIISLVSLYLTACRSDNPSATGADYLNQDLINLDSLDSYKDTMAQISSSHITVAKLATSDMLLLGKNNLNEANSLISFYFGMPDTMISYIKSGKLKIQKSFVELHVNYKLGSPTPGFNFSVHSITSTWATGFTTDSMAHLDYSSTNSASDISFSGGDSTITFSLDTALVGSWFIAEADPNIPPDNGILLKPESSNGILGFHATTSTSSSLVPLLNVIVSNPLWTSVDTLRFSPALDVSTVKGTIPSGNPEDLYMQSGVFINSYLRFDITKLPEHAIINYARLELTSDTTAAVFGAAFTDEITASLLADSTKKDSGISNIALKRSGSTYVGNIAPFVQYWISTKTNNGLLLKAGVPLEGVDLFAVKGSNAADPVKRPRLTIIYTNKK